MAGTVKVPGVGTVPTKYAVAGGLAVVGIAGVAWWRFSTSRGEVEDTAPAVADFTGESDTVYPAYGSDYAADESYNGGAYPYPTYTTPSYGVTTTTQTANPTTNSEWTQRSIEHLENVGVESREASLAVSRYLLKECVTATQADIVRQAVAAVGPPPQGTFSILVCPTTPGQKPEPPASGGKTPGAVASVKVTVSKTGANVNWTPVAGVRGYNVFLNGKLAAAPAWSFHAFHGLKANTKYTVGIQPFAAGGVHGPTKTVTLRTKK